jgi:mono/diheme cytochrome c family protein
MSITFKSLFAFGVSTLALTSALTAQHHDEAHRHPAAAKRKNPVAANAASIASGQRLYDRHCAECHGTTGKGDGPAAEGLAEHPSNFTDEKWEHGSSDGEMFVVIRDGAGPKSKMKGFAKKLTARQIWDVINYVRTLNKTHS